jgi:GNAT superfamily N-acetyltransferase
MNIRKIREDELGQLTELYFHYTKEENLPTIPDNKIQEIWNEIQLNPCVHYFVLEVENKIVASCILSITPSFIRGGNAYGVIEHVVTHGDFRKRGFANEILTFSLEYAWEHGCTEVMLLSGADDKGAHRIYEKLGFDRHERIGFISFKPEKS